MIDACRTTISVFVSILLIVSLVLPAQAQMGGSGRKGLSDERSSKTGEAEASADGPTMSGDGVERRDGKISATGLSVVFPAGFNCEPIASAFASPYRYDGSRRRDDRHGGLHGGIDLSLK